MQIPKIKVVVRSVPETLNDEVFIYWPEERGHVTYLTFKEDGMVVANTVDVTVGQAGQIKPSFTCRHDVTRGIAAAFMELGSKELGIERPSESRATGMLESQSRHLDDLRTLLKLK